MDSQYSKYLNNYKKILILTIAYFFVAIFIKYLYNTVSSEMYDIAFASSFYDSYKYLRVVIRNAFLIGFIIFYAYFMNAVFQYYDSNRDYTKIVVKYSLAITYTPKIISKILIVLDLHSTNLTSFLVSLLLIGITFVYLENLIEPKNDRKFLKIALVYFVINYIFKLISTIILHKHIDVFDIFNGNIFGVEGLSLYSVRSIDFEFILEFILIFLLYSLMNIVLVNYFSIENRDISIEKEKGVDADSDGLEVSKFTLGSMKDSIQNTSNQYDQGMNNPYRQNSYGQEMSNPYRQNSYGQGMDNPYGQNTSNQYDQGMNNPYRQNSYGQGMNNPYGQNVSNQYDQGMNNPYRQNSYGQGMDNPYGQNTSNQYDQGMNNPYRQNPYGQSASNQYDQGTNNSYGQNPYGQSASNQYDQEMNNFYNQNVDKLNNQEKK